MKIRIDKWIFLEADKMMNITELKKGIYWVGAVDWNVRLFHGYTTNRGSSYNAYLIIDEKVTLIDTVKAPFAKELIDRISEIIDPSKIDYLVSNHVEMDHSGAIPDVMRVMPNATIVTSAPSGLNGLKAHFGNDYNYMAVKAGESLNIGSRNLNFVPTPMLHWPDNMVTYCPEEKILFSNDALGQHFASSKHFDDENNMDEVFQEAEKYYANILMPYNTQSRKAMQIISELEIDLIAPSHGIIWRKHWKDIITMYEKWSNGADDSKALVIFDSMWHSTEIAANIIAETFARAGKTVKIYDLKESHISDIMTDVLTSKYIAVGSPTLNNNMLPTVAGFLTYLKGLTTKDKIGMAFGSFGWSGQSIAQVEEALKNCGYELPFGMFRYLYVPKKIQLEDMVNKITELITK